ncbi:transcription elongation factor Elf1 [Phyllobacterium sp. 1468]|nr:transcription elongation factor Elf1 [Phyllobacterium sp. 1468]
MCSNKNQRLDDQLECPKCGTIYLSLTQDMALSTPIVCSSCGEYMGTWGDLEADFYAQGGNHGVFEMRDGQIIRKE